MVVRFYYFRSLYSQSIASLTVGKMSNQFLQRGYKTCLNVLFLNDYLHNGKVLGKISEEDIIIYKVNYKDFEYGIRLFKNIKYKYPNIKIFLMGPFAILNRKNILNKYPFIVDILDNFNLEINFNTYFEIKGLPINKETLVYNIDREIEYLEQGSYINLEASTGCPINCNFCHNSMLKIPYYQKLTKLLVDEIEYLVNNMGKKYLIFNDCEFWICRKDNKKIIDFCNEVKRRNIKFYFMIYLAINEIIPDNILDLLSEIGLVRVFFGIENITNDFQKNNLKAVGTIQAEKMIYKLKKRRISYHIGYILFFPNVQYENLKININYLYNLKKLFRLGMILEKMRILPLSSEAAILSKNDDKVDQAYNYLFEDDKVAKVYNLISNLFSTINERYFEVFFTNIDLAFAILNKKYGFENIEKDYQNYIFFKNQKNDQLYNLMLKIISNFEINSKMYCEIQDIYNEAEFNYYLFINNLKKNDFEVFSMLPHGKECINV